MFSLLTSFRSLAPWPPMPMPAMLSFSLGGVWPGPPSTCRGTMVNAAAASPPRSRVLREMAFGFVRVFSLRAVMRSPFQKYHDRERQNI